MVSSTQVAVRFEAVTKRFGDVVAVDAVDLSVNDGEFFAMLGPSGSGKTTCLRLIAGFEAPTAGRVLLREEDVTRRAPFERDVNTVFQDYALFPHMSVAENVAYGLMVKRVDRRERAERVSDAMGMVRLPLGEYGARKPSQLSGGQRQRVALARALVNQPSLLLLDEPLGALDLKLRQEMQVELKRIQREVGITFIFVTHDQEEALTMSDRLAVFNEGRIEQLGAPTEVYEQPASAFVAGFVGTTNLLAGDAALEITGQGGRVSLRPEKIRLGPLGEPPGPGEHFVEGVVREAIYLGPMTRYLVDVAGIELSVLAQNGEAHGMSTTFVPDRAIRLFWPDAAVRALTPQQQPDAEGVATR
jgi:putative spermidine/putrescine transport system ATP-binding protein